MNSAYEFYGSTLCVRKPFLTDEAEIISSKNYDQLVNRGHLKVVRNGGGPGRCALIKMDPLFMRQDIYNRIVEIEKPNFDACNELQQFIEPKREAISFYAEFKKPSGKALKFKEQQTLCYNSFVLDACQKFIQKNRRLTLGQAWQKLSQMVNNLTDFDIDLPTNPKSLQRKFNKYLKEGYAGLIHGGTGNNNSRKVDEKIESLILSIYSMKNKPFANVVQHVYEEFCKGLIDIVDKSTGELFDPSDFTKNGNPISISESTAWNYINDPKNRMLVDKSRSGSLQFNNQHRPHHHRHKPIYSLSKVSLDDRDLPRKMKDGKRVKAYYAYDVTSGCIIGASYNKHKNKDLFVDCIRDMLIHLNNNGFGIPMEMEVEHHLVNLFKDDLMKAGECFPFVRWCAPGNSQEKHAEHFNGLKKYGYEKRYQEGIGRWYASSEAHRTIVEKVFDEENNTYKEKKYDYDTLVAEDREIAVLYNNDLHSDQKTYPGMTRFEVLKNNLNPKLASYSDVIWAKYVGDLTNTKIRRNQYCRVQHADYQIPSPQIMGLLAPNNYNVEAYYLREEDGSIPSVFLYQNGEFICEAKKIEKYNTATSEQTSEDRSIMGQQQGYVKQFDNLIKEGRKEKVAKVEILRKQKHIEIPPVEELIVRDPEPKFDMDRILSQYSEEEISKIAKDNI